MFDTNTVWFDVALITTIFAVGSIFFGHFETRTPKWRKVVKLVAFSAVAVLLSSTVGRVWVFVMLGVLTCAVLYVHAVLLPRHGINGLTGEPKEKYYSFRGWKPE